MGSNKHGMKLYVPPIVIDEVEDIMREDAVGNRADAFKLLTKYGRAGRDLYRAAKLDFTKKRELPPINDFRMELFGPPRRKR